MHWRESRIPDSSKACRGKEFGSTLERAALLGLQGGLTRDWQPHGLSIILDLPLACLTG
jgi:hypothetical protein